jgi:D-methionine transport system permease protein
MIELLTQIPTEEIFDATLETFVLLGVSMLATVILGLPLGIALFLTSPNQLCANNAFYKIASFIVNVIRSIPFIILVIVLIPVTVLIVGTSLGVVGSIPPLVIGTVPFFARLVENALREVDRGIIEASLSMGASVKQIITGALLPEAMPSLMAALTVTAITLVGYTAMTGVVGGGGLGDLAIRFGYHRFQNDVMTIIVILLVVLVQLLQMFGDKLVEKVKHR